MQYEVQHVFPTTSWRQKILLRNLVQLVGHGFLNPFSCIKILHPSAATSPSGRGSNREETNLASIEGGSTFRLVFESEIIAGRIRHSFRFFKSSLKIRRTTVFGMPSVSAINRDVTFRSSLTILSTAAMLSSVRFVVGRPLRSSSFTDPLPSQNRLCHSKIVVQFNAASP